MSGRQNQRRERKKRGGGMFLTHSLTLSLYIFLSLGSSLYFIHDLASSSSPLASTCSSSSTSFTHSSSSTGCCIRFPAFQAGRRRDGTDDDETEKLNVRR